MLAMFGRFHYWYLNTEVQNPGDYLYKMLSGIRNFDAIGK